MRNVRRYRFGTMLMQCVVRFVLALLLFVISVLGATPNHRTEKINGTIVAYQRELVAGLCFDSIFGASVIVRLDTRKQSRPRYVRVNFAYADNTSPYETLNAYRHWQFAVTRSQQYDAPLKRFFDLEVEGISRNLRPTSRCGFRRVGLK